MELKQDEIVCVAKHLIAQHRQTLYKREASVGEACEACPLATKCFSSEISHNGTLWENTYKKLCSEANLRYSFARNVYPMIPYDNKEVDCDIDVKELEKEAFKTCKVLLEKMRDNSAQSQIAMLPEALQAVTALLNTLAILASR